MVFSHDLAYERLTGGTLKGTLKYHLRRNFLRFAPNIAQRNFVYVAGALCSRT